MQKPHSTRQKSGRTVQTARKANSAVGKREVKSHNTKGKQKRGDKRMNPSSH